jgi:hypothetical protein
MDAIDPIKEDILLSYLVQEITGLKGGSDTTVFLWDNGSIHSTVPATPDSLRGSKLFRQLRHLPPKPRFKGEMRVHRQGGEVKNWEF